jgi:hypothetical protein
MPHTICLQITTQRAVEISHYARQDIEVLGVVSGLYNPFSQCHTWNVDSLFAVVAVLTILRVKPNTKLFERANIIMSLIDIAFCCEHLVYRHLNLLGRSLNLEYYSTKACSRLDLDGLQNPAECDLGSLPNRPRYPIDA